jgi:hypothetical protein
MKRSVIIQRQTDKIKAKNAEEKHLQYLDERDPRKAGNRRYCQYDKAWVQPLIEEED